ncbi:hypothetical protein MMC22_010359 [Lobaria immixta]|nr:hypothetical protein [Lobaria immixta]
MSSPAASNGAGFATQEVRQFLDHSNHTFANGVMERYTGGVTREFWNDRVENPYQSVWTPRLSDTSAVDVVSKPVSAKEIAKWQITHEVPIADRNSESAQYIARHHIRRERHMLFMATAIPEEREKTRLRRLQGGSKVMVTATPAERKKQGPGGSKMVAKEIDVSCPEKSSTRKSKSCLDTDSDNTKSMDWTNVIDPQLWSDDSMLDAMNLDDNELNSFEDQVFSTVLDGPAAAAAETTTSSDIVSNGLGNRMKN